MTHYVYLPGGAFVSCKGGPQQQAEVLRSDLCVALRYRGLPGALCPSCTRYIELTTESAARNRTCYNPGFNDQHAPFGFYCGLTEGHAGPHSYTIPR